MFRNSDGLQEYAVRELQVAVENNQEKVKIVLDEYFKGEKKEIVEFANKLDIKTITQVLREKFSEFDVKSRVGKESNFNAIITYENGSCETHYRLMWTLTLQKKKVS